MVVLGVLCVGMFAPLTAKGMYDPKHGRWLERDPFAIANATFAPTGEPAIEKAFDPTKPEPDGTNSYEYVRSRPSNLIDPQGLLAVIPRAPAKFGKCGDYFQQYDFEFPIDPPCSGWIIQKVEMWAVCKKCEGGNRHCVRCPDIQKAIWRPRPDVTYWEAIRIDKKSPRRTGDDQRDTARWAWRSGDGSCSCGFLAQKAEARFYCDKMFQEHRRDIRHEDGPSHWPTRQVGRNELTRCRSEEAQSGPFPHTQSPPRFWTRDWEEKSVGPAAHRYIQNDRNCCEKDTFSSTVSTQW